MDKVALRIILKFGVFIDLYLTSDHANQILQNWKSKTYQLKNQQTIDGVDLNGTSYAVDLESVMAMHTGRIEPQAPAALQNPYNRSGRN